MPPNVRSEPSPQRACDIASFLVSDFIKAALQSTIDGINAGHTILNIFTAVVLALPFDLPVDIGAAALNGLFTVLTSGTLADFEAAEADSSLWAGLTCAVFHSIQGVGYVDASNFAAMESAICGYSYVHTDVISAICSFVSNLGLAGVQQLQNSGALAKGDCSGCGAWCYEWNAANGFAPAGTIANGTHSAATGWHAQDTVASGNLDFRFNFAPTQCSSCTINYTTSANNGSAERDVRGYLGGSLVGSFGFDGGAHPSGASVTSTAFGAGPIDEIRIVLNTDGLGSSASIDGIHLVGTGVCPFGAPNC